MLTTGGINYHLEDIARVMKTKEALPTFEVWYEEAKRKFEA